jgi:hypothetical protein
MFHPKKIYHLHASRTTTLAHPGHLTEFAAPLSLNSNNKCERAPACNPKRRTVQSTAGRRPAVGVCTDIQRVLHLLMLSTSCRSYRRADSSASAGHPVGASGSATLAGSESLQIPPSLVSKLSKDQLRQLTRVSAIVSLAVRVRASPCNTERCLGGADRRRVRRTPETSQRMNARGSQYISKCRG